jgi:surface protein
MDFMFYMADAFNQDLSQWNTSSLTSAEQMFSGASNFNSDLSAWHGKWQVLPLQEWFPSSIV